MIRIGNAQFWVHDQDAALDFYTKVLGWEVRSDVTMAAWNFRWLAVGPAGQDDVGLVLMPVPGPPMLDGQDSEALADLVLPGRPYRQPAEIPLLHGDVGPDFPAEHLGVETKGLVLIVDPELGVGDLDHRFSPDAKVLPEEAYELAVPGSSRNVRFCGRA